MNKVTNRILKKWSILLNSMLIYMLTSNIILQDYIYFICAICLHNLICNMCLCTTYIQICMCHLCMAYRHIKLSEGNIFKGPR